MWGDRKVSAVLFNHQSDSENTELSAPWLCNCPSVHLHTQHVGIPQSFVPKCCRVSFSFIFASYRYGQSHFLARERTAAAGASLNHADRSSKKAEQGGQCQRGTVPLGFAQAL